MRKKYIRNPGTLKIDLMLRGIKVNDPGLLAEAGGKAGVDIVLNRGTRACVPLADEAVESPYSLVRGASGLAVSDGQESAPCEIVKRPAFLDKKTQGGVLFSDIAASHGSYVVITPTTRCDFFNEGVECKYCAGNYDRAGKGRTHSVDDVLEVVEAVKKEKVSDIIYVSIGFSDGPDGGIEFLAPYIKGIKKYFNTLVAVEALPPRKNSWIDDTYAMGADSVLYNLEIFDPELFELICPGRAELIGQKRYKQALKYAAGVFPSGTVASHLIVGLEPPGSTRKGIDFLTGIGVVPILPIYRPTGGRALRIEPLTAEVIIPVYKHLYEAVKEKDINMNWVREISVITTPIEGKLLIDGKGSLLDSFYKSRLGLKTAWGLSTIRRKLRVKHSDHSHEEA
jgi:biotin synthase-related radical SAM superfamily protein